jgi:hypothetical protein
MKSIWLAVCLLLVVLLPFIRSVGEDKPTKNPAPLTADEIAIYKAIVGEFSSLRIDVSGTTFPLLSGPGPKLSLSDRCFADTPAESVAAATHSFHDLTPDVLLGKDFPNVRLVSPADKKNNSGRTNRQGTGAGAAADAPRAASLLVSEIAFDKEHRRAVVTYAMWCGRLCGDGATLVFEKTATGWKANRRCGDWVS